ncbi:MULTISPECIES: two component system sensor kinase [Burkholderia]|uniref:two component system sensor kinase n=1 Tax=Burkholderia TaxID=32008 RepID=UPI000531E0B7|nr:MULTISPECIES: two component system sensor kinase [Burkholderia]AOJ71462.1 hybrid sensor histidine kinase/response regulator [Burkholderia savannae]AOK49855.1 hybrid sensor histidine kinase/response regulator [Burkholderia sp. MSMB617WGS]KGS02391.1 HAMP domain protein [Burkholderia sp. ABCPW 111]KVG37147.1 hybrid sensor histidine kinase/response regulator [Burkholderia sp. MSMB0265]KVG77772.1 hybrid sensor histidine kinase/response regulator [Burkholderia sp. MSMB2040]
MSALWEKSLTARIMVILSCAMTAFWLLSESIGFYFRYIEAQRELRSELTWQLESIAQEESRRYEYAERQARMLLSWWNMLDDRIILRPKAQASGQHAIFVPFKDAKGDRELVDRAREIVEIYGHADPRNRMDTFLLLPTEGIVLFEPERMSKNDMQRKIAALATLRTLPKLPVVHWGAAITDSKGVLRAAAAVVDPHTGIVAGQNLRVGDIPSIAKDMGLEAPPRFALQSQAGDVFWMGADTPMKPPPAFVLTPKCDRTNWNRRGNYYVICTPLSGPNWQLAAIYPVSAVTDKAMSLLPLTTRWTFVVQLLLIAFVYVTLQRQLGRPLQHFVDIIDAQREGDLGRRLPTGRRDELGRIGSAYNSLLSTVNAYYKTLESKVRERTRELAEAKRIAESASHRKSEHIASISHELRTPLNGIVGALALLNRSALQAEQRDLVRVAQQSSCYLLGIVNNVLDFSRIEAGQLELASEQTDLLALLDQAMLTIHIRAHEKSLSLRTFVTSDVPRRVWLDGLRVRQILINLLGNAMKFTEQGHIHLSVERRADMLAFVVEDTGKGIPDEYQLDIFKPFVQVRAHDSGNGLGLPIASRLANLMNGEILLDSKLGKGTRFTVLLPLQADEMPPAPLAGHLVAPAALHMQLRMWGLQVDTGDNVQFPMPESGYLPGKLWDKVVLALRGEAVQEEVAPKAICPWSLKILVVDDVAVNRDIVGKMLRELGHRTRAAASGQLALKLGRSHVFDLVLMDVRMPELDGMATAKRWRHVAEGVLDPDTPIVALTANASPAEHERARAAGMNGYLTKPVSLEQLADMINQVASTQLARGVELTPNAKSCSPLFDLNDAAMREKLHQALVDLHRQIDAAWHANDVASMLNVLHALKGCAGQGGLDLVREAAEQQERQVRAGGWTSCQDVRDLAELISIQFA